VQPTESPSSENDPQRPSLDVPPVVGPPVIGEPTTDRCGPVLDAIVLPDQPRLGIIHIMLWTAGSAVILAVYRALAAWDELPGQQQVFLQVRQILFSMSYGAAVGGLGVFLVRKLRGVPYPLYPGHWILLNAGILTVLSFAAWAVIATQIDDEDFRAQHLAWNVWAGADSVIGAAVYFYPTWRLREGTRWTLYFSAQIVISLVYVEIVLAEQVFDPWYTLRWDLAPVFATATAILLLVAVLLDWRSQLRRDWLHWTGVTVCVAGLSLSVVSWVAWRFIFWPQ